ncbi:diguanylate cyclase/phosphodiesterase (GGDEF & EAL domains) with PAS/PAC sensor(s) [hydrothermal vent metagenome]|uniref:histidine kinase n=1 Tax=hydrothermal vent metagenome TaxID=652676 RepID=A0A3B1BVN9_9ZZZZ
MSDSALADTAQPPGNEISRRMLAEQVKLAFNQIGFGLLATMFCAIAYMIVVWDVVPFARLLTWFTALTALTFIRRLSSTVFFRQKPGAKEAFRWSVIFNAGAFLSGLLWGVVGVFLFPENFIGHQVFLILLVAGLSAGTASTYTAIKWAPPLFIIPSMGILTIKISTISGDIYPEMGAVMAFYTLAILGSASRINKATTHTLSLRFENVGLIEELEKTNKKFKQLSEATFEGVLVHDKGEILFTNNVLPGMFGYKAGEVKELNALDFVAPEHRDFAKDKMLSGAEEPYETSGISKDGRRVPVEIHGKPVPYEDRIVRMVAIRDLTQRKESETALKESEERYRDLFENANDLYYTTNLEGKFTSVNMAILDTLGYRREELLGKHYSTVVPPELIEKARKMTRRKLDGEERTRYELEIIGKDGRQIPVELSTKLIIKDGEPVGVQGAARDMTERKKAEDALKILKRALDQTSEMVSITNNKGVIEYANRAMEKVTGYSSEELIGRTPRVFKSGEHGNEFYRNMWDTIKAGDTWSDCIINKNKSGELADEEMTISPIKDHKDDITHFVAIKRDISERKQSEEKLKKAKEKAEEATRLKDKFVSLVAHDLKTPFNSILGFLALLRGGNIGSLNPQQQEIVDRTLTGGEKLVQMIDDLLDLSLLQSGKLPLRRIAFSARGVIDSVVEEIGYLADSKNIRIEIEVLKIKKVYADMKLFHGVIRNLMSNAIKFCDKGGLIKIFTLDDSNATIAVSNTGVEVEPGILDNLFKHEIKTTTRGTSGEEGTGFGLPFCHDVMKAHGGSIRVESKKAEGSVFYVCFPSDQPD